MCIWHATHACTLTLSFMLQVAQSGPSWDNHAGGKVQHVGQRTRVHASHTLQAPLDAKVRCADSSPQGQQRTGGALGAHDDEDKGHDKELGAVIQAERPADAHRAKGYHERNQACVHAAAHHTLETALYRTIMQCREELLHRGPGTWARCPTLCMQAAQRKRSCDDASSDTANKMSPFHQNMHT